MTGVVSRDEAFAAARAVLDRARARRDAMPIRAAAEAAAAGSRLSADEIELVLRRLHRQTGTGRADEPALDQAA